MKRGDVVQLKSGGKPMMVEQVYPDANGAPRAVDCTWITDSGVQKKKLFPADFLKAAE